MHRSSESIAALAAAFAKAQSELTNPEKSLVGTIGTDRQGRGPETFDMPRSRVGSTSSEKASSRSPRFRHQLHVPGNSLFTFFGESAERKQFSSMGRKTNACGCDFRSWPGGTGRRQPDCDTYATRPQFGLDGSRR